MSRRNDLPTMYSYVARRLSAGDSIARTVDLGIKRFGADSVMALESMVSAALEAFAAGAWLTSQPPDSILSESQIPDVPGYQAGYVFLLKVEHNPGEYIWVVNRRTNRSVDLATLLVLAVAAQRDFDSQGHATPTFGGTTRLAGEGYTAYRGGKVNVPEGFFRVTIERVEREIAEGSIRFFSSFGHLAQRVGQ